MKIRGNTVGTTQSPEKTLTNATNLDKEQQKKARDNIGASDRESVSQGRSANYPCYTSGWKRVLVTTRGHGGIVTFHTGKNRGESRVFQNIGIVYSGFVDYPTNDYGNKWGQYRTDFNQKPMIYQLYNNIFGDDTEKYPERKVEITKVRLGYPVPGTTYVDETGETKKMTNPVKCYLDVYLDFDVAKIVEPSNTGVGLVINYCGRSVDYDTLPIMEETDATDTGLMGETLQFTVYELSKNVDMHVPALRADNMPYERIVGTADNPIVFSELPSGCYYLGGRFKYGTNTSLIGSSLSDGLYVVKNTGTTATVLRLAPDGNFRCYTATASSGSGKDYNIVTMQNQIGDIDTALDSIIAIQNELIGGEA